MSIPVSALQNLTDLRTPPEEIKYREGPGGRQLAYVDARYGMGVLDALVGPANWQRRHSIGADGRVGCDIGIFIEFEDGTSAWVWKGDGAGETDIEGEKGSFSDSFKRALVNWGPTRDLYAMKPQSSGQSAPRAATPAPARPAAAARSAPVAAAPSGYGDEACPDHGQAWVLQPGGTSKSTGKPYPAFWKCPSGTRPWCKQKPSEAWQAAHEIDEEEEFDSLVF